MKELKRPRTDYRRPALFGLAALFVLFGGVFLWSGQAEISGAVLANGSVVVAGKPKSVQHLDGGIVKDIHVAAGERVETGHVLVELDDTTISANVAIYRNRWRDGLVRRERLLSELRGLETVNLPAKLSDMEKQLDVESTMEQQRVLLRARKATRAAQIEQLEEQINQFSNQIVGTEGLIKEKNLQIGTFDEERLSLVSLVERKIVPRTRLMELDRSSADLRGQLNEHTSEIARLRNAISEKKIAKLQIEREFQEAVVSELEKVNVTIDELEQQIGATEQQLLRTVIRAPVTGIVHELNVFTIGGVVQPGQTIMQLIPDDVHFDIELNVDTRSIDQIRLAQRTFVRFPAFLQRTTPQLNGVVKAISPSSVTDENTGFSFYRIEVELEEGEIEKLGGKRLVSGMPVEGFVPTENRTVAAYLVKPLADQLARAFREE